MDLLTTVARAHNTHVLNRGADSVSAALWTSNDDSGCVALDANGSGASKTGHRVSPGVAAKHGYREGLAT